MNEAGKDALIRKLLFLPPAASAVAREIDRLHFLVISVTLAGAVAIAFLALVFIVRYRQRTPRQSTPRIVAGTGREIGLACGLLLLFIAFWTIGFQQYVSIETRPGDGMDVYVTGKQWMWKFSRPDGQRTAGVLVVPTGKKVRLLITSRDVVHSFYVPALRIKQDAIPGRYTSLWFVIDVPGTYPIYCAEYCGVDHSRMWASVVALAPREYERWLGGDVPPALARAGAIPELGHGVIGEEGPTRMADEGRNAASRYGCFSCHTIDGQPHLGPSFAGLFDSVVTLEDGRRVHADEEYLTRSMMDPRVDVVNGYRPVMPTYQGVLEQPAAAAIVEFIKSLRYGGAPPAVALPRFVPETSPERRRTGGAE